MECFSKQCNCRKGFEEKDQICYKKSIKILFLKFYKITKAFYLYFKILLEYQH